MDYEGIVSGFKKAVAEAYPDQPDFAGKLLEQGEEGVYRYMSQILCANKGRADRIYHLVNALYEVKDSIYSTLSRLEDAGSVAERALEEPAFDNK